MKEGGGLAGVFHFDAGKDGFFAEEFAGIPLAGGFDGVAEFALEYFFVESVFRVVDGDGAFDGCGPSGLREQQGKEQGGEVFHGGIEADSGEL